MKKAFLALAIAAFAQSAFASVVGGPHDLSASGPAATNGAKYGTPQGTYAGLTPCSFCHAVHKANTAFAGAPLWNRPTLTATWTMYPAANLTGGVVDAAPNAASLTCLTCHEGTAALGVLFSTAPTNVLTGGTRTQMDNAASRALVTGADLSNDHPVSFPYVGGAGGFPTITNAGTSAANVVGMPLYGASFNRMECATCHDPHLTVGTSPRFLRVLSATICGTCHTTK
jgi:predicted CXXCH cytochrome family protein